jgi:hypothetical protein
LTDAFPIPTEFAKQLFDLQTKKFGSKERKKELKKKNKGKDK